MSTLPEPFSSATESPIPLCVPMIRGNEWNYVKECLDTNFVSSVGPFVDRFERMVAGYLGASHSVATVSGTAALHVALVVAGVQPDDEVVMSALSFIAPANAARYIGAWPVFMDAEPDYWQMDPDKLLDFLNNECRWHNHELRNKRTGRRVKAVLPVHILGHPCDMDPIMEAAHKYELAVIEDATESLGGRYKGRMIGCLGDIACLSFNGNKIITTGGGGMLITESAEWARRAKYLTTQAKDDPVEYIHHEIGFNYRLTNVQAALGCAQMEKLVDYVAAKRSIASAYMMALPAIPGVTGMSEAPWAAGTFWMYTVLVDGGRFGMDRNGLMNCFAKFGVETRPLWQPLHLSPAHKGCQSYRCDNAANIYRNSLSLPSSVNLSRCDQERVIGVFQKARNAV